MSKRHSPAGVGPRRSSGQLKNARRGDNQRRHSEAFTRLELVAILGILGLLAALALPALANTRARADRAACVNNLSRIGQAFNMWAAGHGELYPMHAGYSG